MNQTNLSVKALNICKQHHDKNCGNCPLRTACVGHVGPGQESLNKWTSNVNELAKAL